MLSDTAAQFTALSFIIDFTVAIALQESPFLLPAAQLALKKDKAHKRKTKEQVEDEAEGVKSKAKAVAPKAKAGAKGKAKGKAKPKAGKSVATAAEAAVKEDVGQLPSSGSKSLALLKRKAEVGIHIPTYHTCEIIPYWSRNEVGLKLLPQYVGEDKKVQAALL